jgi:hypothetical protein
MILWKEAWLRRVDAPGAQADTGAAEHASATPLPLATFDGARFFCQATELPRATTPGEPLWRPGQYVRLLRARTFTVLELARALAGPGLRWVRRKLRARPPAGAPDEHALALGLKPGQWVEIKSREEILRTLDARGSHRGLPFSGEMYVYCGRRLRVQRRVERIVDESTGRLRVIADTVLLEGSVCEKYFGCARGMPLMWREAWLRPITAPAGADARPAPAAIAAL